MNCHSMRNGVVSCTALMVWGVTAANAQVAIPTHEGREAHANTREVQEIAVGASTKVKESKPFSPLLPIENRIEIKKRLMSVRKEIENTEDLMFKLTDKHRGSLVTSRDRWHSELDRVQTEIRLADKDLATTATKSEQMKLRMDNLVTEAGEDLKNDRPLATLKEKLQSLEYKHERIRTDANIKEKSLKSMLESATAEIIDARMEIAQREESLRLSYKGGQAEQLKKDLRDLEVDVAVKASAKKVLEKRFEDLQGLAGDITTYARLERKVDELQILHRKLSELSAQQAVEFLKSTDVKKQDVPEEPAQQ